MTEYVVTFDKQMKTGALAGLYITDCKVSYPTLETAQGFISDIQSPNCAGFKKYHACNFRVTTREIAPAVTK